MSSKTQKIRDAYTANILANPRKIAAEVGCDLSYVYVTRNKFFPELTRKAKTKTKNKRKKLIKALKLTPDTTLEEIRDRLPTNMRKIVAESARKKLAETDMVNSPPHYTQGGIETYDFIVAKGLSYELGNVVKYITRADHKGNRLQDLQKALWYLNAAIDREETK